MYKLLTAILAMTFSVSAFAAPEELLAGDPERGEALTTTCAACHGPDGNSPSDQFPSIAGQHEKYTLKQLWDVREGRRQILVMTGLLDGYTDQQMADIAAYYAVQTPQQGAADPEKVALGERIYRAGIPEKGIAACAACHGPTGKGHNFAKFPMIAGQWPAYTVLQMKNWRSGERNNDGESRMMRAVAENLSDPEIEALASYLYGLR